ncbi:MAG: NADH-quinone oxidoreductase subunit NuoE [bacterium]|nr:NADH-quinone oxidoreductase subunit NuoE [bacterium]
MDDKLKEILENYKDVKGNTIAVLQAIQDHYTYLPAEALEQVSEYYHVSLAELYGVATFYSQFKFNKPGEFQIKVCHGTACHINSAVAISDSIEGELNIKAGETTEDKKFSLDNVACLGCCSLAPVIMINDKVYGNLDEKKVKKVLKEY